MNTLVTVDLDRLRLDDESFLGQAIALGVSYGRLPESSAEGLKAFLQICGLRFGQRNRSGIALCREELQQGVELAIICIDMGLSIASGNELERAVDVLAEGDFERLRKQGWEFACLRLERMQREASLALQRPEASFLQDYTKDAKVWAGLVPETWMSEDAEGKAVRVSPTSDFDRFLDMAARLHLFRALPKPAFKAFRSAAGGRGSSEEVLRNVVVALALQRLYLVLMDEDLKAFGGLLVDGRLSEEVHTSVLVQVDSLLDASPAETDVADRASETIEGVLADVAAEGAPKARAFVMRKA